MILKPYGNRLVVKRTEAEKQGLIHIPDQAKKISLKGEVLAVGAGVDWVEVGDMVLFARYSPYDIEQNFNAGEYKDCCIVNEDDILGKLIYPN